MTRRTPYRRTYRNSPRRLPVINLVVGAGIVGAIAGVGSVATTTEGRDKIAATVNDFGVASRL